MSVIIENLTKTYGSQKALDSISFEVKKGEVTGFLGPNGAGKSTTMKIATGYVGFDKGKVRINQLNVADQPLSVKKITGYLPEHNPLYLDMYVKEYLSFIARAYKTHKISSKVGEMIERCGLTREQHKKIRMLSKGYRQRVGLAQSLIHDPQVLILDEPTSGLDPNQLVEIRQVIKEASVDKTVLLSSHIMQEVEALCEHVVIINQGKIVADDNLAYLKSTHATERTVSYWVEFESDIDAQLFAMDREGITIVKVHDRQYKIEGREDPRKHIMKIAGDHGLPLINIRKEEKTLEGVFQKLTQA